MSHLACQQMRFLQNCKRTKRKTQFEIGVAFCRITKAPAARLFRFNYSEQARCFRRADESHGRYTIIASVE